MVGSAKGSLQVKIAIAGEIIDALAFDEGPPPTMRPKAAARHTRRQFQGREHIQFNEAQHRMLPRESPRDRYKLWRTP